MRTLTLLALTALLPNCGWCQDRIVGLVEVPALHSRINQGSPDLPIGPVALFAEPNHEADVAFVVRNRNELESREHGYEQVSAEVYALAGNAGGGYWYKLRRVDGIEPEFGWLNQADVGTYHEIHDLLISGLTYLTGDWDARLFESPSLDSGSREFEDLEDQPDVRIADIAYPDGEPWYLVVIVRGSCSGDPIEVIATGWIRAYSEAGGNTVWHYSRGC